MKKRIQWYAWECPECDWMTWLWKSMRAAYSELVDHMESVHRNLPDLGTRAE